MIPILLVYLLGGAISVLFFVVSSWRDLRRERTRNLVRLGSAPDDGGCAVALLVGAVYFFFWPLMLLLELTAFLDRD